MGVVGVVPFQNVTAAASVFRVPSTASNSAGLWLKPGILNAVIVNATGSFALYDAQANSTTNSTLFSGSVTTAAANLIASFSYNTAGSGSFNGLALPVIVDLNVPFYNGVVVVGNNNINVVLS